MFIVTSKLTNGNDTMTPIVLGVHYDAAEAAAQAEHYAAMNTKQTVELWSRFDSVRVVPNLCWESSADSEKTQYRVTDAIEKALARYDRQGGDPKPANPEREYIGTDAEGNAQYGDWQIVEAAPKHTR